VSGTSGRCVQAAARAGGSRPASVDGLSPRNQAAASPVRACCSSCSRGERYPRAECRRCGSYQPSRDSNTAIFAAACVRKRRRATAGLAVHHTRPLVGDLVQSLRPVAERDVRHLGKAPRLPLRGTAHADDRHIAPTHAHIQLVRADLRNAPRRAPRRCPGIHRLGAEVPAIRSTPIIARSRPASSITPRSPHATAGRPSRRHHAACSRLVASGRASPAKSAV
jgi:hypothetical protein